jgi:predicted oxidoreductase
MLLTAFSPVGCATTGLNRGSFSSQETVALNERQGRAIAEDLGLVLKERFGPGQTVFELQVAGRVGQELESLLRMSGYAVTGWEGGGTKLEYVLDSFDAGSCLVSLRTATGFRMTRLYRISGPTVEPASPYAVSE